MKQVRETKAGRCISAYVILRNGKCVATVQSHYADSGRVTVDVWDKKKGEIQQGSAGGGGYDKFTAALRGMSIDGVLMNDHCGTDERTASLLAEYGQVPAKSPAEADIEARVKAYGAYFSNWDQTTQKYTSIYLGSGLDLLKNLGYEVIQAI